MKVAISAIRTNDIRINRYELVTKLKELGHNVIYLGQDSKNKTHPDYEKYNVIFKSVPLGRTNTNPFRELMTIKETTKVLKDNGVEALIAYGIRTFPTMVTAARLAGVKQILCVVNGSGRLFQLKGAKGFIVKSISYPMLWSSFLLSDRILFQNPDDMKMVRRKGLLWRENYGTIGGSGVNLDEYPYIELEKKPVFSMISRLTGSKGVNEYVQAAFIVKKEYPEALFYLVGPMDDEDSSINTKNLQKAVDEKVIRLKGKVEDVRPIIKNSRVFVLPSYYPEGIPRSILEAMAMGRPIITADSSGCRETVINGVNGFLVPPKDPYALAEKMSWMITNTYEVSKMGQQSRKICEGKFEIHKVNKIMLNSIGL